MKTRMFCLAATAALFLCAEAEAQHLWWDLQGQNDATCLYGEITVLATHPAIYYCGANWHPGEPAGGYCGIQHNGPQERRTIFSIWDTSPDLHPTVTAADPRTILIALAARAKAAHTHMLWPWNLGETFQFFVQKVPGRRATPRMPATTSLIGPRRSGSTVPRSTAQTAARRAWRPSAAG